MGHASDPASHNAEAFAVMPHARRAKTDFSSKNGSAKVKQAAYGETRTAIIKKKLMKNKLSIEAAAPANAVQPSSAKTVFIKHHANRQLPTQTVLDLLKAQLPRQYELAEVVGQWVWLDVSPARKPMLAKVLWTLGFHWNQRRGVWQHPCGRFDPFGSHPTDPRAKYRSYFPADGQPA